MFLKYQKKMAAIMMIAIFFVVLDRFLKVLAINYYQNEINLVGNLFKFNLAKNYNIAFSLPLGGTVLNFVIILIIIGLLYYLLALLKKQEYSKTGCLIFLILGAISNLIDRFNYGYVIDYFDLKYFTVFNLADVMIVGGVIGLGWLMIRENKIN